MSVTRLAALVLCGFAVAGCGDSGLSDDEARDAALAALNDYERQDAAALCARLSTSEREIESGAASCEEFYGGLFDAVRQARSEGGAAEAMAILQAPFLPGEVVGVEHDGDRSVVRVRQPPPQELTDDQRRAVIEQLGEAQFTRALERRRTLVIPVTVVVEDGEPRVEFSANAP